MAEPGALLAVPVDLDDGVVDIEQRIARRVLAISSADSMTHQRGEPANATRNRAAIASSWRTWPKVNARKNEPNVDGA